MAAAQELASTTGRYFESNVDVPPAPLAQDAALAARLWDVSVALTGLK
jgi:hypothetical protein